MNCTSRTSTVNTFPSGSASAASCESSMSTPPKKTLQRMDRRENDNCPPGCYLSITSNSKPLAARSSSKSTTDEKSSATTTLTDSSLSVPERGMRKKSLTSIPKPDCIRRCTSDPFFRRRVSMEVCPTYKTRPDSLLRRSSMGNAAPANVALRRFSFERRRFSLGNASNDRSCVCNRSPCGCMTASSTGSCKSSTAIQMAQRSNSKTVKQVIKGIEEVCEQKKQQEQQPQQPIDYSSAESGHDSCSFSDCSLIAPPETECSLLARWATDAYYRVIIRKYDGISVLCHAMVCFPMSESLQISCCTVLSLLASEQQLLCHVAAETERGHPRRRSVQHTSENSNALSASAGLVTATLVAAIRNHRKSIPVQSAACQALQSLQIQPYTGAITTSIETEPETDVSSSSPKTVMRSRCMCTSVSTDSRSSSDDNAPCGVITTDIIGIEELVKLVERARSLACDGKTPSQVQYSLKDRNGSSKWGSNKTTMGQKQLVLHSTASILGRLRPSVDLAVEKRYDKKP